MRFFCFKSGYHKTSTRSSTVDAALTKSVVVNIQHHIEYLSNAEVFGKRFYIENII